MNLATRSRLLAALCRLVAGVFYRDVEILGRELVSTRRPLLLVANHGNALVDPLLVYAFFPGPVRFLAKSTLWQHPVVRYLVEFVAAIPVYRRQDAADTRRNLEAFEASYEVLAAGGVLCLFPEGMSHLEPRLQPLKTGVARIALEAERRHGPLGLKVQPVGLNFEERSRFRSRVLMVVGEPLDVEATPAGGADRDAVARLTASIGDALGELVVSHDSWREAELVARAAEIWARPEDAAPAGTVLAASFALHRAFAAAYRELRVRRPGELERVYRATDAYDRALAALGLADRQVASRYRPSVVGRYLRDAALFFAFWSPLAAVGTLLNWLPFRLPGWLTAALGPEEDQRATYKILISLVVFPLAWALEATAAGVVLGVEAALFVLLLAPASGWAALVERDRWRSFRQESRAFLTLRRRGWGDELKRLRRRARDEIERLVALYAGGEAS